ncbi:LamG-like jellyroll fold domain-containing protein [Diaphorobacter sp.]|uniref:LamG-like jellyroll fold domain-containing protein n=1 Tax=Diaphorobacter sp. TaxID=1934310 RepID=UPI002586E1E5|nr:LamG-like jellyroll fold domain-containing protein [Diaphorobacter sp.]
MMALPASLGAVPRPAASASGEVLRLEFDGADGSTTIVDTYGKPISRSGAVVLSTAQAYSGASSGYFPGGTSDYLTTPASADFNFGAGDFSVKAAVYPTALSGLRILVTNRASSGSDAGIFFLLSGTALRGLSWGPAAGTTMSDITGGTLVLNAWQRVEYRRVSGQFQLLINDAVVASSAVLASAIADSTNALRIGVDPSTTGRQYAGYMDQLVVRKG